MKNNPAFEFFHSVQPTPNIDNGRNAAHKYFQHFVKSLAVTILVFLWVYTGLDKLLGYSEYSRMMHLQTLPREILPALIAGLPIAELSIAVLLILPAKRIIGLYCSLLIMSAFTAYTLLVYFDYFSARPCACAGLFQKMSWGMHVLVNSFLTLVAVFGIITHRFRRKEVVRQNTI